jgi:hypothetical protein
MKKTPQPPHAPACPRSLLQVKLCEMDSKTVDLGNNFADINFQ